LRIGREFASGRGERWNCGAIASEWDAAKNQEIRLQPGDLFEITGGQFREERRSTPARRGAWASAMKVSLPMEISGSVQNGKSTRFRRQGGDPLVQLRTRALHVLGDEISCLGAQDIG